jgi:hypothetical protein
MRQSEELRSIIEDKMLLKFSVSGKRILDIANDYDKLEEKLNKLQEDFEILQKFNQELIDELGKSTQRGKLLAAIQTDYCVFLEAENKNLRDQLGIEDKPYTNYTGE